MRISGDTAFIGIVAVGLIQRARVLHLQPNSSGPLTPEPLRGWTPLLVGSIAPLATASVMNCKARKS